MKQHWNSWATVGPAFNVIKRMMKVHLRFTHVSVGAHATSRLLPRLFHDQTTLKTIMLMGKGEHVMNYSDQLFHRQGIQRTQWIVALFK